MTGKGAGLTQWLSHWQQCLGKGWDLSMGTLASVRPAEWSLSDSSDPVGWTGLSIALRVGAGYVLWPPSLQMSPQGPKAWLSAPNLDVP